MLANAFSKLDSSAYPQAWEEIDKDVRDAMDAYLEARGRDEAVQNGKRQRDQNERDAIRQSLEQQLGGQFWREGADAPVVEVGTLANGKQVYILSEVNEQGEVAAVREDGERVIINNGMLLEGTQVATLDDFLETQRSAQRQQAEQARMSQEAAPQINAIRQQMVMGATINLGPDESPIMGTVVSGKPEGDGVLIQTESGVMPYTYEQIADIMGTPIRTMTDVQIASAEAAEIQAAEAARRNEVSETAQQMQEAETEAESARQEAEIAEEAPLPTNPDGTVNEDALFNQSAARWAEWNDAQQNDGGASSAEYIFTKLQKAQSTLEKLQAQYKKEDSLNKRRGIQTAIAEQEQVVADLAEVAQRYAVFQAVAQAEQQQEQAPAEQETEQQATPTAEQTLIDLFSDDSLSEEEIEAYVDANVSGSQSDLDKHLKKAPKMGRDMEKFKVDRAKHDEKTKELTAIRDYWRQVKSYLSGNTAEMSAEPQNALEAAAYELSRKDGLKLLPESFRQHTGYGRGEQVAFLSTLRKKENGGMTLEAAGERLMAEYPEFFDENDPNAGLNAILDVLQSAGNSGVLANYIANARQEVARQESDAVRGAIMQQVEDAKNGSFEYYEGDMTSLVEDSKSTSQGLIKKVIAPANERLISDLGNEGIDIDESYNHTIDNSGVRHILKNHGTEKEYKRGQIPITEADFELIGDIVNNYDEVLTDKNKRGQDVITYVKSYPDGTTYYVEEVRVGRKELAADTMYKRKNRLTDANGTETTQISDLSVPEEVYNRHTTDRQSAETAEVSQDAEQGGTQSSSSMNTSTASSESKDSNNPANSNESEEKINIEDYDDLPPGFRATDQSQEEIDILAPSAEVIAKMVAERREAVHGRVAEWEKRLGVKVNVLDAYWQVENKDVREAISQGKEVWGWFESSTGEVFIYTPDYIRLKPEDALNEVDKTIVHEAVAHKGLREFMGQEKFNEFCDKVWNEVMTEKDREKFINYPGVNGNTRAAADEYMASISEKTKYDTIWDKIARFFKELLGIETKVSDKDIRGLLKQSYANLAKNGAKTNPDSNQQAEGSVRFRTASGSLVGMHNISEEKLRKVIKQGGLANPSTAVVNIAEYILDGYGDISLIMPSSLVDQDTGDNVGTYTGDAWTPTYPPISRQVDEKGWKAIKDVIRSVVPEDSSLYYDIINGLQYYLEDNRSSKMEFVFLKTKGIEPEIAYKGADGFVGMRNLEAILGVQGLRDGLEAYERYKSASPMAKRSFNMWLDAGGNKQAHKELKEQLKKEPKLAEVLKLNEDVSFAEFDSFTYDIFRKEQDAGKIDTYDTMGAAARYVDANNLRGEFESWLESLMEQAGAKEVFFAGYTRSGERIYKDNTLENVSRHMRLQGRTNAYDDHGLSATKSALLQRLTSLSQMRKNKAKLQNESTYNKEYDALKDRLFSIIQQLADMQEISSNQFMNIDYAESRLQEAITKKNPVAYLNKEYGYEIDPSGEYAEELNSFIKDVQQMPAKYFETKFERPVYLNEFAAAVMPTTTSEDVKQAVAEAGLPIFEYDSAVEGSRREATLKATEGEGIRFRTARTEEEFNATQQEAVREKGIIVPGLWETSVNVVDVPKHDFTGRGIDAIHKAEKWALEHIVKEHIYHDGQEDQFRYLIDEDTVRKFLSKSSTGASDNLGVHLAALKMLPQIIDNSIDVEIHPDYRKVDGARLAENGVKDEGLLVHRMYGAINIDGKIYRTKTTIHEFRDKINEAYDYKITEIELIVSGSSSSNARTNPTSVSAAKLLKGVEKSYDKGVKVLDVDYFRAIESGDMETAQRMVNEAAKLAMPNTKVVDEDGNPLVVYHGTGSKFYTFRNTNDSNELGEGYYFSDSYEMAERYATDENLADNRNRTEDLAFEIFTEEMGHSEEEYDYANEETEDDYNEAYAQAVQRLFGNGHVKAVFLNIENPFVVGSRSDNLPYRSLWQQTIDAHRVNDGIIDPEFTLRHDMLSGNQYVAFKPAQIKSADPVTYDDAGNVIPLSERFNEQKSDIRFRTTEDINSQFNSELQQQINGTLPRGHVYQLGMPSRILRSAGIPNLPIEMASQRLVHKSNQVNHPFELSEVADLPRAIQNPLGVFRSATHIGSNVILTELRQGNKNFVVAIETNRQQGKIRVNSVRSLHPRTTSNIISWINDGLMDYADNANLLAWIEDKIKSRDYLNSSNPADVRKSLVSAAKIVENFENPSIEDVRFRASNENQAIFVSNAARAVEGIKQEKATPEQWLKMIEKNGGLKAGEDKWMGLSDWLKSSDKKTLTKQEVLDFINENMIVIEETHYSEDAADDLYDSEVETREVLQQAFDEYVAESEDINDDMFMKTHYDYAIQKLADELGYEAWNAPFINDNATIELDYQDDIETLNTLRNRLGLTNASGEIEINSIRLSYTTEGLTDKHEIALTVPTIESWNKGDDIHFGDAGNGRAVAWIRFGETYGYISEYAAFYDFQKKMQQKYFPDRAISFLIGNDLMDLTPEERAEFERLRSIKEQIPFRESRSRRVLVIDEIQSKRHQEGREKGYAMTGEEYQKRLDALETEGGERLRRRTRLLRTLEEKYGEDFRTYLKLENTAYVPNEDVMAPDEVQEWYATSQDDIDNAIYDLKREKRSGIPDAPFDKNWHELAMKRMLRYAAENGYDVIAWTKGEQQAERYNLANYFSTIERQDNPEIEGRRFVLDGYRASFHVNEDGIVIESTINDAIGKPLVDIVGKELAIRIMQMEDGAQLAGLDLAVGGEGMKGFYDKMLPAFMNKYGKKWGVKVEEIALPGLEDGSLTMHSVPVTEEMKSSVMEGQTMFRATESDDKSKRKAVNNIIDRATAFVNGTSIAKASELRRNRERKRKEEAAEIYSRVLNNQFDDVTLQLIDKYIQDATPKNPYGRRISQRLPQEMERGLHENQRAAAVNALFSRISESAVPEADRASQQGKREIETKKKELLKNWAIASGMWYDNLSDVVEIADVNPIDEGTESKVYASTSDNTLVKVKRGKPFGKRFRPDIDDLVIFNHVFPNTAYTIVGYGDFGDGISTIVTQPVVNFAEDANVSVEERVEHMESLGFKPMNKDNTAFTNGKIVASDIQGKNIVKDINGDIRIIDADMKLHTKDMGGEHVIPPVEDDVLFRTEKKNSALDNTMDTGETSKGSKQNDTATLQDTVSSDKDSNNSANYNTSEENTRFRATGVPTESVVEDGLRLTPKQFTDLAANIFKVMPEDVRREVVDKASRDNYNLERAVFQKSASLAEKSELSNSEIELAKAVAEKVEDAVLGAAVQMQRPLATNEALWMLYQAVNPVSKYDLIGKARMAVVADNLGFSPSIKASNEANEANIRFRATSGAYSNSAVCCQNIKDTKIESNSQLLWHGTTYRKAYGYMRRVARACTEVC